MRASAVLNVHPFGSRGPLKMAVRRAVCGAIIAALAVAAAHITPAAAGPAVQKAFGTAAAGTGPATELFGWGRNDTGQLARPATLQIAVPQPITLPGVGVTPMRVKADNSSTFALGSDGHLYAWGQNRFGQLGDGTFTDRITPGQVNVPGTVTDFGTDGGGIEYAVTSDGTLYQWGFGWFQTDGTLRSIPTPEARRLPGGVDAISVSPGYPLNVALGADHKIYSWHASPADAGTNLETPTQIPLPGNVGAITVEAESYGNNSAETFQVLGTDGQVYTWGLRFPLLPTNPTAVPLPSGAAAVAISNGFNHFFAQDSTGQWYGWGINNSWQLGDGTLITRPDPIPISLPGGAQITSLSAGLHHTLAIGSDGRVYGWGSGGAADLQKPTDDGSPIPILQSLPNAAPPIWVEANDNDDSFAIVSNIPYPPRFTDAVPPRTTQPGTSYQYTFHAVGDPAPRYSLSADAPAWLQLNTTTGVLSGTVPADATHATFTVTATNTEGIATAGPFDLISGVPVSVTGTAVDTDGSRVAGAHIDGCSGSTCTSTLSAADGTFALPWYAGTSIAVTVYPPQNLASRLVTVALAKQSVPDTGLALGTVQFPARDVPAPITDSGGTFNGLPVVHWAIPFHVALDGCAGGMGLVSLVAPSTTTGEYVTSAYIATEDPASPGHYVATIPALYPLHGYAQLGTDILCPSDTPPPTTTATSALTGDSKLAGTSSANLSTAATLAAVDPYKIVEAIYQYGPKVLALRNTLSIERQIAGILLNPGTDCQVGEEAVKLLVKTALRPAVAALAASSEPLVLDGLVALFALNPIAAIAAYAIVQVVWPTVVSWMVGKFVDWAVKAAFKNVCKESTFKPNMLIDPSGTILDQHGSPIPGAVVTLLRADTVTGPFTVMDTSDDGIEPATNPETTDGDGVFHWDVRAGYYIVQASAAGCHAPGDTSRTVVTLGPLPVPPPQVGLHLTLDCPGAPAPSAPSIAALDTALGPPEGGNPVTLTGSGFTPTMAVTIGGIAATSVQYLSTTSARVIAPAGTGTVHTRVTTDGGISTSSPADLYTYATPPHVTSVSPSSGPLDGGTAVVIQGSGFTDAQVVAFGSLPATSFIIVSDTQINAVTPPGAAAGDVTVQVANAAGAGPDVGQFTFQPKPSEPTTLTVSPATASAAAGHPQAYTAHGVAADGTDLGDQTPATTFTIAPAAGSTGSTDGATCATTPANCSAVRPGTYIVTGSQTTSTGAATGTATLVVTADAPASVLVTGGDAQSVAAGQPFPNPLRVAVADQYGNPTPGVTVTFAVTSGSGSLSGSSTKQVETDTAGTAAASLTAGTTAGVVTVTATVAGLPSVDFVETVQATGTPRADLSVQLASPPSLARNTSGTVTVTVSNAGPQAASPVYAAVRVPSGLTVTATNPSATRIGGTWLFRATSLAAGKETTFTLTVKNSTLKKVTVSLSAAALSPVVDLKTTNNVATTSIRLN